MSSIYLVRHGQASFGSANYDELSDRGRRQSRILGEYLLNTSLPVQALYSGEMKRQLDTAREISAAFEERGVCPPPLRILPEFNEYDSAAIVTTLVSELAEEDPSLLRDISNMADKKAFQRAFELLVGRWVGGDFRTSDLPRWEDFKNRVRHGLDKVKRENGRGKNILVFTSGGPISAAVQASLGLSDLMAVKMSWQVINTSLTRLIYSEDRLTLASFNNAAHLELAGDASLITYR
ncbi:MAG: histidine phosphatase family protein [Smithellaceae bacterium]|nr:histidine phosphatase family protein [Smithellaceae bacterium]